MSNQPSTSAAYYQQRRWTDNEESSSDDDDRGRMATSTREIPAKNDSAGGVDHSEESDENGSDNDEVEAPSERRGQGRPVKYGVKSCAQLQARSDGGQLAKKPKAKPGFFDGPPPGEETDNGEEEEDEESTTQPLIRSRKGRFAKKPKGRFAKKTKAPSPDASQSPARESDDSEDEELMQPPMKKKATVLTAEQAKNRKKLNDLNRKKTAQWNRTAKRVRPLNRYIQNRPPSPEMETDEEPKLPPPPPTEKQLAARLAANEKRRRKDRERKEKREQMLARKRETERMRRLFPSTFLRKPARGSIDGCPSTRTTDRTGYTTTWEQWKHVIWYDEEEKAKEWKRRVKENNKPIHKSKPRTGPPANKGIYAAESRKQLEKEEKNGFKTVTHRTKKKEETDSEEEDDQKLIKKSRYHSAKTLKILEDEFKNAQYLDEDTTRRLVRITKLKSRQISNWFANTRRKVQQKFKNGKIAELPKQMKALEEMNEERKERGEHLRMKKEKWESDDDSEDEEEDVDDEETQDDEEDVEEGEDDNEEDDGNRRNQMKKVIDHLSTEGYPVYPGWR
ncbi:hypothetical protein CAEBREN_29833 [Caenorhabditis brenneri]|uniref:Homeobox domain-containing protein n=1 Tax=Caenorhabditis brenneri TaxID=135651 RepID=G0MGY9_CAEBE|nr:hypothetical protein CAEBREN_29833 [Caenorhabditis brenneri]